MSVAAVQPGPEPIRPDSTSTRTKIGFSITYHFGWPSMRLRALGDHGREGFGYGFAGSTTIVYNDIDKVMISHFGMNVATGIYGMAYRVIDASYRALLIWIWLLALYNRFSKRPVVGTAGPVVSLTSYGKRIQTVHFTIESIAGGTVLPSRLILWLDDRDAYSHLPATLSRLKDRGLEILLCPNYGPHTKYYPYVDSQDRFDLPMVIADDDILYPSRWLQGLQESLQAFPECVSCYLAREMKLDGDRPAKYREWKVAPGTDPSIRHVAQGVNGTIFPAPFLRVLKAAGTEFLSCCPKADDIWLHVQAVRAGFETRQISKNVRRFAAIPGTQEDGLWIQNQNFGGNDRAISATYTPDDISLLGGQFADPNSEAGKDIELGTR